MDTDTPFTVSDSSGNLFQLVTSGSLTTGANSLTFQAVKIGYIQVAPNTLNIATTVTLGVLSVNNPAGPTVFGSDQETDAALRTRRQQSVSLPSQGNFAGLLGGLYTVSGLIQAIIYENTTNSISYTDLIPAHGIWVIVNGGSDADIADMIYRYRPLGCPMKGDTTVMVDQADGTTFEILFDRAEAEDLYAAITVASKSGADIDETAVASYLAANSAFTIYQTADISALHSLIHAMSPDLYLTTAGVSKSAGSYTDTITPTEKYNYFTLDAANIAVTI